ncbi:MAG: hypothetical protein ASARMPRED_000975 [Alectoria sarmentosa]|nr:MAG: hypothetical protein ASARMPRED_000975 [Alectoria sarmentosa]
MGRASRQNEDLALDPQKIAPKPYLSVSPSTAPSERPMEIIFYCGHCDSTSFAQPVPPWPRDIHLPRSTPNQILQEPTEYDLGCDIIAVETSEQLELSAIANKGSQRCTFPKLQSLAFVNCLLSLGGLLNIAAMHKTTIKGLELHRVIFDPGHYIDGVADIANICKQHLPNLAYLCLARLLTYSKDYTNPHWDHTGKVEALEYHEWRMGDREIRTKGARLGLK